MFQLQEKIAVVTGREIGKAMALLFARQDVEVHEIELNEEAGDITVKEIYAKN